MRVIEPARIAELHDRAIRIALPLLRLQPLPQFGRGIGSVCRPICCNRGGKRRQQARRKRQ